MGRENSSMVMSSIVRMVGVVGGRSTMISEEEEEEWRGEEEAWRGCCGWEGRDLARDGVGDSKVGEGP
jgi:hypothetical protein